MVVVKIGSVEEGSAFRTTGGAWRLLDTDSE